MDSATPTAAITCDNGLVPAGSLVTCGGQVRIATLTYATNGIQNGSKFLALGLQTASGVPLQCDEPAGFSTFRIGLFGLDKLHQPERCVAQLAAALDRIGLTEPAAEPT